MIIYIDETGDLGFNFKFSRTSKFFVITALVFNNIQHYKRTMMHLEKVKRIEKIPEIKGKSLRFEKKEKLHFFLNKLNWELHSLVIDKRKITQPKYVSNFYDEMVSRLLSYCYQKSDKSYSILKIVIDKSKNSQQEISALNTKIENNLKNCNCEVCVDIHHGNSKNETGLQMVDLYSYGIYKKFENGDKEWFKIFEEKIKTLHKI